MRNFLVYDAGREKLRIHGLTERIDRERPSSPYNLSPEEAADELTASGFLKAMPANLTGEYKKVEDLVNNPDNYHWTIDREKVPVTRDDTLMFQGYTVMELFKPKGMWAYQLNGFDSLFEFWGTVTAQIETAQRERIGKDTYQWLTVHPDEKNRKFLSQVTGDMNADLMIDQDDVTEYEVKDPFGNSINYRPMLREHEKTVIAGHSLEPHLLVAIMKWIEQTGIESELIQNPGLKLNQWGALGSEIFNAFSIRTEQMAYSGEEPITYFTRYDQKMPDFGPLSLSNIALPSGERSSWGFYVGKNKELVISRDQIVESKDKAGIEKEVKAIFLPEDTDQLLKSLIVQAKNHIGRTPVSELMKIILFKTTGQYESELARTGR